MVGHQLLQITSKF